jgi:hypothetical protein
MSLGCRGVIGPNYNPRSGDVANVDDANKRKHESIGPAETGHNKTRIVRKTTTAIPFGLPQFSESVYEASRRFRAVRVPGVALIVRHTPFSS